MGHLLVSDGSRGCLFGQSGYFVGQVLLSAVAQLDKLIYHAVAGGEEEQDDRQDQQADSVCQSADYQNRADDYHREQDQAENDAQQQATAVRLEPASNDLPVPQE